MSDDRPLSMHEASEQLAEQLQEKYRQRIAIKQRIAEGLTDRGRFRRNAKCPCGSGVKFKKCCRKKFKATMDAKRQPQQEEAEE